MIRFLAHNEIDVVKWDHCISESGTTLPYAYSWWLDTVNPGWNALIMDDYLAVMPLTGSKKLGFNYLFQPWFTQQLGIFSPREEPKTEAGRFLQAIPGIYRFVDIQLNAENIPSSDLYRVNYRTNFELKLDKDYMSIYSSYHRNCRRNVQKAKAAGLKADRGPGASLFSRFVARNIEDRLPHSKDLFTVLEKLLGTCEMNGTGKSLGIYRNQVLLAAGWIVEMPERVLFMACASTMEGKQNQAMYALVDHIISTYAGTGKILDFTGSTMPGVAYFNAGFGAIKTAYPSVKRNTLPWYLKMLKK
ncbi:MAG TPA: hypothetical protein VK179_01250 [Bacteroidales bacterium]|nr:hypothetical protein [Bacteroidales bacterium]